MYPTTLPLHTGVCMTTVRVQVPRTLGKGHKVGFYSEDLFTSQCKNMLVCKTPNMAVGGVQHHF